MWSNIRGIQCTCRFGERNWRGYEDAADMATDLIFESNNLKYKQKML